MKQSRTCLILVVLLGGVVTLAAAQAESTADPDAIQSARSSLAKWVETEQIISEEKEAWQLGREVLEQRIALLEDEVASRRAKVAEMRAAIAEAQGRQSTLATENRGLSDASSSVVDMLGELETQTRALLVSVPVPLARRVEPLSRKIPRDPAASERPLAQRFQNLLGVLNEINKFNREIVVTREMRDLPDGSTAEVETIYLGLGQAYYVTPSGSAAGIGIPGPGGWEWLAANELADEITQAIEILEENGTPAYVPLPVQLQ